MLWWSAITTSSFSLLLFNFMFLFCFVLIKKEKARYFISFSFDNRLQFCMLIMRCILTIRVIKN